MRIWSSARRCAERTPRVRGRLEVLIPGVPVAEIRAALGDRSSIRKELGVTEDEVVVMTLANYRPPKRYPDLFQAMRLRSTPERRCG